jgi:hypothetical protein
MKNPNYAIGEIVNVPILHGNFIITEINPIAWQHLDQPSYKGYLVTDKETKHYFVESQISHQVFLT